MNRSNVKLLLPMVSVFFLIAMPDSAFADVSTANIYETVLDRYQAVASTWAAVITRHANWLFWTLSLISMVWTFGLMALRKADIQEFFAEFVKFTIFTGFFWWLLTNGPHFADTIIQSLRKIAGEATGLGPALTPSTVADIGFDLFFNTLDKSTMRSPLVSAVGVLLGLGVMLLLALVAANMLVLLVSGWVLLYGGIFFLGFGGSRWTSDMAINYYKTVLGVAAALFSMVLIIGVAASIMDQYYREMGPDMKLKELAVVLVVAFIMALLVRSVPPLISGIITGASVGQGASMGFGAGAIVGAGSMAAAAVATGGAAIAAGAASAAGGAQALMAAFSKANATETASGDVGNLMMQSSGRGNEPDGSGNDGGSAFASAMGGAPGSGSFGAGNPGASESAGGGSSDNTEGSARQSGEPEGPSADSEDNIESQSDGASGSSAPNVTGAQDGTFFSEGDSGGTGSSMADDSGNGGFENNGGGKDYSKGGDDDGGVKSGSAAGKTKSSSTLAASGAAAAKIGKVTAGTFTNLAQGTWDVTKAKGSEMIQAARDRVGDTTGGKIAAAIKARDTAQRTTASMPSTFDDNNLSAGTSESPDADSEVAAFRDRDSKNS
jgi:type IV secretion system protein TrbL